MEDSGRLPGSTRLATGSPSFSGAKVKSVSSLLSTMPRAISWLPNNPSTVEVILAILPAPARQGFLDFIVEYRAAGGKVAFDSNFRQRLWPHVDEARGLYNQVYALTDMALLTLEDEQALFGAGSLALHQHRLKQFGIGELVLKEGPEGCLIDHNGEQVHVAAQRVRAVDTTSAGDSFNAGYLAERIAGKAPLQAAKTAHGLAALVVQHQGAIVPRNVTDSLSKSLND